MPADYIHAITGAHHYCFTVSVSVPSSIIIFSCLQRPLPSYKVTEYHEPCGLLSENERMVKYVSEYGHAIGIHFCLFSMQELFGEKVGKLRTRRETSIFF